MLTLSPATEALILDKAAAEGKTPDEVVQQALAAEREPSDHAARSGRVDMEKLREILKRLDALPVLDPRSEKEICDEGWGL